MWKDDIKLPAYPSLTASRKVDVAIVGGGITGLTAAYLLKKSGKDVVVLEKGRVGDGATAYSTGFLTQVIDTALSDVVRIWGAETAGKVVKAHRAAINTIEKIAAEEKIECEFVRCPHHIYSSKSAEELERECAAARDLGMSASLDIEHDPASSLAGVVTIPDQAKMHPLKYLNGLARSVVADGVELFEKTPVHDMEDGRLLYTKDAVVEAKHILVATHAPFVQPPGLFFRKGTYITHVFELEVRGGVLPEGTYEDTENPYHYFRVDPINTVDRVLVGGEDHRKGIPISDRSCERALENFVKRTFGHLPFKIVDRWKGPILEPLDGLPFIGPYEYESTFYASGFSGNGLTYGTIAARMFADHVLGREN
ncbi:MAG TPA: FAD-dependent oxidoreductase, partial [Candidatus Paceibacterota bacterium]|nr:FAD-dependent oxidoreductase [Candidatus Paceibacterota bacterium]